MLNMDTLKAGDKIRRIEPHDFAPKGAIFEVETLPFGYTELTVKDSPLGLARPEAWELVEEPTLYDKILELAEVNERASELIAEIAELQSHNEVNKTESLVAQAKEDVKDLTKRMKDGVEKEGNFTFRRVNCKPSFHVNERKGVVTAIVRRKDGLLLEKGFARCHPNDTFLVDVGKAIALRRALELEVPEAYTKGDK